MGEKEILVQIVYVGKKPTSFDNVARSGKVWNGNGDVQEVTPEQAKTLLKYPDQWALVNKDDAVVVDAPVIITSTDPADGAKTNVTEEELAIHIEKMTVPQLRAYAQEKFGKELDGKKRAEILDELEELIRTS